MHTRPEGSTNSNLIPLTTTPKKRRVCPSDGPRNQGTRGILGQFCQAQNTPDRGVAGTDDERPLTRVTIAFPIEHAHFSRIFGHVARARSELTIGDEAQDSEFSSQKLDIGTEQSAMAPLRTVWRRSCEIKKL